MKLSMQTMALSIVIIFVGSVLTGFVTNPAEKEPQIFDDESNVKGA